jgi:uncharacterized membrane protein YgcG
MKRLLVLMLILLLSVNPVLAQDGGISIHSDTESLDGGSITAAAQPLIDRGAFVMIYLVDRGEAEAFTQRLEESGVLRGDLMDTNVIALFVSLEDRYMEISYGEQWASLLDPRYEGILSGSLGPNLREGDYTLAFVRTLERIEQVIAEGETSMAGDASIPLPTSQPYTVPSYPSVPYSPPESSGGLPYEMMCVITIIAFSWVIQRLFPNLSGSGYSGSPRYKSSWSSGHRSFSSGRSSISRSSGGGRRGGGGGRW